MNTQTLLPLAAALFIACAGSALLSAQSTDNPPASAAPAHGVIVDLPTVSVRPDAADLAYFQSNRIVDLAAVTVRPRAEDLAPLASAEAGPIVDLPTLVVFADADDVRFAISGALATAGQLATR